ncbi:EF-P 5-aminopentanol modification-associated protein YfmH [Paenibacillus sp. MMS18-CY102]|uniref:EF-P 5-aminopentanol modification-associated protein YfmH n=1 Tax=Paenibacillus sp. MMS18-CY102 TaxID=2682849 RepID=UPI00136539B3|nr:pitrilysin family protein [Paenibacillus sp. MMS18-CY102]MWC26503.1 peptidase M16 [Paenibacillus sp. MMS18-CY102]
METLAYPGVQETLYREVMPNGLEVFVLPKEGFQKTYATFSTKYGSVDNRFAVEGKPLERVPDGIAHFLEHKMFEEPTGDIFATFSNQGASANAYTSFDRTVYLFSATEQIPANLETLINFVQHPYFTDENVNKEKGIIEQEIQMYQDNPDWRVYFGLFDAMYHAHPIHIDIAGTVESIYQISKETLYSCYETFYHPTNMILFVVGGVNAQDVFELVRKNQASKSFPSQGRIVRDFDAEPAGVKDKKRVLHLPVSLPKCMFGLKETKVGFTGEALQKREAVTRIMLDTVFGASSPLYQSLYDEGLISDSFSHEYNSAPEYAFSVIGGETKDPDALLSRVKGAVNKLLESGISKETFERSRRKKIGGYLRMLNSPEAIAGEFTRYRFRGGDLFALLSQYEQVTLQDLNDRLREHFDWNQLAVSIVASKEQIG